MSCVLRFLSSAMSALSMAVLALVLLSTGFALAEQITSTLPSICGTVVYQQGTNPPNPIGCIPKNFACHFHPSACSFIYYDPTIGYYCGCSDY